MDLNNIKLVEIFQVRKVQFCMGIQIRGSVVFAVRPWNTLTALPCETDNITLRSFLGEGPLPLFWLSVLMEVFSPFSYGFLGCFSSIPSKSYILEGVATSWNCNTAGLGTWDIWFYLGRISVRRPLDYGSYVNAPKSLYLVFSFWHPGLTPWRPLSQ